MPGVIQGVTYPPIQLALEDDGVHLKSLGSLNLASRNVTVKEYCEWRKKITSMFNIPYGSCCSALQMAESLVKPYDMKSSYVYTGRVHEVPDIPDIITSNLRTTYQSQKGGAFLLTQNNRVLGAIEIDEFNASFESGNMRNYKDLEGHLRFPDLNINFIKFTRICKRVDNYACWFFGVVESEGVLRLFDRGYSNEIQGYINDVDKFSITLDVTSLEEAFTVLQLECDIKGLEESNDLKIILAFALKTLSLFFSSTVDKAVDDPENKRLTVKSRAFFQKSIFEHFVFPVEEITLVQILGLKELAKKVFNSMRPCFAVNQHDVILRCYNNLIIYSNNLLLIMGSIMGEWRHGLLSTEGRCKFSPERREQDLQLVPQNDTTLKRYAAASEFSIVADKAIISAEEDQREECTASPVSVAGDVAGKNVPGVL